MSFFNKGKGFGNFFFSTSTAKVGEPSIREEVEKIIHTEKRGSVLVYRRVRRDTEGHPVLSSAARSTRSSESLFKNNEGMKFLFDDHIVKGYINQDQTYHDPGKVKTYGDSRTDQVIIYLEADVMSSISDDLFDMPDEHDKIIIPEFNIEGILRSPLAISEAYDITTVEPFRLDGTGRVEFFKLQLKSQHDRSNRL